MQVVDGSDYDLLDDGSALANKFSRAASAWQKRCNVCFCHKTMWRLTKSRNTRN